jgi:hypothetical protein
MDSSLQTFLFPREDVLFGHKEEHGKIGDGTQSEKGAGCH